MSSVFVQPLFLYLFFCVVTPNCRLCVVSCCSCFRNLFPFNEKRASWRGREKKYYL